MVKICSLSSMLREKVNIPKKGYYASRVAAFYNYIFNQTIKLLIQNSQSIAGNHQLFISWDNSYCHFGVIGRNNSFFSTNLVLFKVNLHTHEFQTSQTSERQLA